MRVRWMRFVYLLMLACLCVCKFMRKFVCCCRFEHAMHLITIIINLIPLLFNQLKLSAQTSSK